MLRLPKALPSLWLQNPILREASADMCLPSSILQMGLFLLFTVLALSTHLSPAPRNCGDVSSVWVCLPHNAECSGSCWPEYLMLMLDFHSLYELCDWYSAVIFHSWDSGWELRHVILFLTEQNWVAERFSRSHYKGILLLCYPKPEASQFPMQAIRRIICKNLG